MPEWWQAVAEFYANCGVVMPFLLGASMIMWYGLGWRGLALRGQRVHRIAAVLVAEEQARGGPWLRERLEAALWPLRDEVGRWSRVVMALVALAPLAGLLGTVTGMIETFDSLATMSLFSQGGGVAAGVAEALFSTQMGLAVAVPGLIVGRLLDGRQRRIEEDLDELVEREGAPSAGEAA